MAKWEDMTEKKEPYADGGYQNVRTSLIIALSALAMSVYGLWLDSEYWRWCVALMALASFVPAIFGYRDRENPYILWSAVAVAIGAIMLQYWMMALLILFILAVLVTILSLFGVPF